MTDKALAARAVQARAAAYAPYSGLGVGAALLAQSGAVYVGANIENAAFTPTNCAERTAFFTAVAAGERAFEAIAVAGWRDGGAPGFAWPCGVCRQVMMEFCAPGSFRVLVTDGATVETRLLHELQPLGFGPASL